jgi:hypothetical protein
VAGAVLSAAETSARRAWLAAARWAHNRGDVPDDEVFAAFEAWWTAEHPPPEQVPDDAPSWWHGCWLEAGHYLHDRRGGTVQNPALDTLPLDGGYAPRRHRGTYQVVVTALSKDRRARDDLHNRSDELPQGQYARTIVTSNGDVYTILSWWDRTQGDTRGNCSSCFIVHGRYAYSSAAMVAALPRHFPKQAARLAAAGVQLVEAELGTDR